VVCNFSVNLGSVLVILLSLTNILFSYIPLLSLYKFLHLTLYYFLFRYLLTKKNLVLETMRLAFPLMIIWVSVLAIGQFLFQSGVGGLWSWLGERPLSLQNINVAKINLGSYGEFLRSYSTLPHPNALGGFLSVSIFVLLYLLIGSGNKILKIVTETGILLSVISLLLTFSRSSIFSLVLGLLLLFSLRMNNMKYKQILFTGLILLLISLFYFLFINLGHPASIGDRLILTHTSLSLIKKNVLFGIGFGTFPFFSSINYQPVHNVFLLMLSELGMLTAIIVLLAIAKNLFAIMSNTILLTALFFILLTGFLDHYWITSQQNIILLIFLLFLLKTNKNAGSE